MDYFLTAFLKRQYEYSRIGLRHSDLPKTLESLEPKQAFDLLQSLWKNRPQYCAFPNGPFAEFYLGWHPRFSFHPEGILIRIQPSGVAPTREALLEPVNDFWDHYLSPAKRSANPIHALFQETCAHPFFNTAQYLSQRGDYKNWDQLFARGLSLVQEGSWQADELSNYAKGCLASGRRADALRSYEVCAGLFEAASEPKKANAILEKIQHLNLSR